MPTVFFIEQLSKRQDLKIKHANIDLPKDTPKLNCYFFAHVVASGVFYCKALNNIADRENDADVI